MWVAAARVSAAATTASETYRRPVVVCYKVMLSRSVQREERRVGSDLWAKPLEVREEVCGILLRKPTELAQAAVRVRLAAALTPSMALATSLKRASTCGEKSMSSNRPAIVESTETVMDFWIHDAHSSSFTRA